MRSQDCSSWTRLQANGDCDWNSFGLKARVKIQLVAGTLIDCPVDIFDIEAFLAGAVNRKAFGVLGGTGKWDPLKSEAVAAVIVDVVVYNWSKVLDELVGMDVIAGEATLAGAVDDESVSRPTELAGEESVHGELAVHELHSLEDVPVALGEKGVGGCDEGLLGRGGIAPGFHDREREAAAVGGGNLCLLGDKTVINATEGYLAEGLGLAEEGLG